MFLRNCVTKLYREKSKLTGQIHKIDILTIHFSTSIKFSKIWGKIRYYSCPRKNTIRSSFRVKKKPGVGAILSPKTEMSVPSVNIQYTVPHLTVAK